MAESRLARIRRVPGLQTGVKVAFGVAVLFFGGVYISGRWNEIQVPLHQAKVGWLVVAAVLAVVGLLFSMLGTRFALSVTSGRRLPLTAAGRVFFISQLGKYIPGSVWPVLAVTAMSRKYRISAEAAASGGLLALFLSLIAGGSLGVAVTLAAVPGRSSEIWWLLLLLPVAVLVARPSVVFWVLNFGLRLIRRPPLDPPRRPREYALAVGSSVCAWLFMGLQCWALCVALGADPGGSLLAAIGGFALAYTAGTLFVPAPAGVGVREAVLTFALGGTIIDSTGFDAGSVLAVVLMSRVLLFILDFAMAGVAVVVDRLAGAPVEPVGDT